MCQCPYCHVYLDDGDIYEELKKHYPDKSHEELIVIAKDYGWTPENKIRFSRKIGVYDMEKDRTMHYECPDCGKVLE
jgi:hypothetical protein